MDFVSNLVGLSRPAKRQKIDSPSTPTLSPSKPSAGARSRSSQKQKGTSVLFYGSAKKQQPQPELCQQDGQLRDTDVDGLARRDSPFTDSAYQSMTAPGEVSEQDGMALEDTPSRRKSIQAKQLLSEFEGESEDEPSTPSRKRARKFGSDDAVEQDDSNVSVTLSKAQKFKPSSERPQSAQSRDDPDELASTTEPQHDGELGTATRSSRRPRKKSQRQMEAEEDTIVVARARGKAGSSEGTPVASTAGTTPKSLAKPRTGAAGQAARSTGTPTSGKKRGRPPKAKIAEVQVDNKPKEAHLDDVQPKNTNVQSLEEGSRDIENVSPLAVQPQIQATEIQEKETEEEDETVIAAKEPSKRTKPVTPSLPATEPMQIDAPGLLAEESNDDCLEKYQELTELLEDEVCVQGWADLREDILRNLTGKQKLPLVGLETEYYKVHQLVEQTVSAGEGNSMLMIGPRGSAKSVLLETIIDDMAENYPNDFHVVRLNGFIHTDDKIALKEIWRQLGREMQVEDEEKMGMRTNYADTLASLLALLSHPTEVSGEEIDQTQRSIIFIIDEFELFASHPRQTLLYNLFDTAQARKAPIVVLGLTTKIDVVESLEKRVKSRFSHRYVYLSLPKTYSSFTSIISTALTSYTNTPPGPLRDAWSTYTSSLLTSPLVVPFLRAIYRTSKSIPTALTSLLPAFLLSATTPPSPSHISKHLPFLLPPDSKLVLLQGLPTLALALLIAAARLDILLSTDALTFAMAHEEYIALTNRTRVTAGAAGATALSGGVGGKVWGREVCLMAWENLVNVGLLVPIQDTEGRGEVGGRLWRVDVALEEIRDELGKELGVMGKWCREMAL